MYRVASSVTIFIQGITWSGATNYVSLLRLFCWDNCAFSQLSAFWCTQNGDRMLSSFRFAHAAKGIISPPGMGREIEANWFQRPATLTEPKVLRWDMLARQRLPHLRTPKAACTQHFMPFKAETHGRHRRQTWTTALRRRAVSKLWCWDSARALTRLTRSFPSRSWFHPFSVSTKDGTQFYRNVEVPVDSGRCSLY